MCARHGSRRVHRFRCVTIKAVGGSCDQINDVINPIKYHRGYQQCGRIPRGIGSEASVGTPNRSTFISSFSPAVSSVSISCSLAPSLRLTIWSPFFSDWWMMQITTPPPDATVERSRSTFLSRWLVLRWQVLRRKKRRVTGWVSEWKKREMRRYAHVEIFTLLFFSLGILGDESRCGPIKMEVGRWGYGSACALRCSGSLYHIENYVLSFDFLLRLSSLFLEQSFFSNGEKNTVLQRAPESNVR